MNDLPQGLIDAFRKRIANWRKDLEPLETGTMRIGERHCDGPWSDVTDREIALLKNDISSTERTLTRLEEDRRFAAIPDAT